MAAILNVMLMAKDVSFSKTQEVMYDINWCAAVDKITTDVECCVVH